MGSVLTPTAHPFTIKCCQIVLVNFEDVWHVDVGRKQSPKYDYHDAVRIWEADRANTAILTVVNSTKILTRFTYSHIVCVKRRANKHFHACRIKFWILLCKTWLGGLQLDGMWWGCSTYPLYSFWQHSNCRLDLQAFQFNRILTLYFFLGLYVLKSI